MMMSEWVDGVSLLAHAKPTLGTEYTHSICLNYIIVRLRSRASLCGTPNWLNAQHTLNEAATVVEKLWGWEDSLIKWGRKKFAIQLHRILSGMNKINTLIAFLLLAFCVYVCHPKHNCFILLRNTFVLPPTNQSHLCHLCIKIHSTEELLPTK